MRKLESESSTMLLCCGKRAQTEAVWLELISYWFQIKNILCYFRKPVLEGIWKKVQPSTCWDKTTKCTSSYRHPNHHPFEINILKIRLLSLQLRTCLILISQGAPSPSIREDDVINQHFYDGAWKIILVFAFSQ